MMSNSANAIDGLILMGPFGAGKSYLGKLLCMQNIARYTDLEPIIYERFSNGDEFDLEGATHFLRNHYYEQLSSDRGLVAFESTGVVQRPLLLEIIEAFQVALVKVHTPRSVCLQRVNQRNQNSNHPINLDKAAEFFDYWCNEVAPTYEFALEIDGTDADAALRNIRELIVAKKSPLVTE